MCIQHVLAADMSSFCPLLLYRNKIQVYSFSVSLNVNDGLDIHDFSSDLDITIVLHIAVYDFACLLLHYIVLGTTVTSLLPHVLI